MKKRLLYVFFCLAPCWMLSYEVVGADTTVVRDLSHDWYFYDVSRESYFPLVNKASFRGKTLHFDFSPSDFDNSILQVKGEQGYSLFLNNQMIGVIIEDQYYDLDSLKRVYGSEEWHFTIYHKNLDPFGVSTQVVKYSLSDKPLAENPVIIRTRQFHPFYNFVITALILIGAFLAALYNYFPRVLSDFFKVRRAFALRESDENLFKSRPLGQINLLVYLYLSFLAGLVLMLLVYQTGIHVEAGVFNPGSYWDGLWKWLQLSMLIMLWLFVKYLLISNLSSLFRLGGFMISHYFNYIRMSLIIFSLAIVIMVLSYFGFGVFSEEYYSVFVDIVLAFLGLRVAILFFKLLSSASYKTLHLFSYLCGTEVIPFGIILYLGLNQLF
ncbi:DUF4271 domain-containing protein [Fulvivirga sp. 29W222]|uniref:DUF4271 domain-containing protein n=1 Tax=Fulvivirga marina TaxID=2494733 RepID=A0A937G4P6_9BACT|nr:DUF4271 domain-containing protein [Fulvivirga marina]MBL6449940.1 DUF4271 domain-containing protein [Fulvivirga marina]